MRVLIGDRLAPQAAARLRDAGHEVVERYDLKGADLIGALADCQALIVRGATKVTGEVLRGSPTLRVVARAGTGLDNIDVAVARELGVTVLNTPAANAVSVAELTIGLMIAFERHLIDAASELRRGQWEKTRFMGRELTGKVLGLVGFGRIGREVAMRARAFGMTICAHDPLLSAWPAGFEWARRLPFDELLATSDFVSLHLPLTAETRNLIGERQLALMKREAVLVNCARGGTVDEAALESALREQRLRGAIVDVFATEPPGRHPLLEMPNVVPTPHLGASTVEAQERAGVEAADLVIEALGAIRV